MRIQLFSLLFYTLLFSYNTKPEQYQPRSYTIYTNKDLESLHAPIIFSASGIKHFFTCVFNKSEYAQEVLPNDFSHLLQWLDRSIVIMEKGGAHSSGLPQAMKKARAHSKSVLRVFKNKIHACSYINAYAFDEMLAEINEQLHQLVRADVYKSKDPTSMTYDILYSSFSTNFSLFKRQPRTFLMDISRDIIDRLNEMYMPDASIEELRSMFIRFLEASLNKLVWNPYDGFQTWESVKSLADHLADLVEDEVLQDVEDLNDLFTVLLERYMFCIDIGSKESPTSFYTQVKEDIANNSTILLELEEQEEFIESKQSRLIKMLEKGQARALAREIVTI